MAQPQLRAAVTWNRDGAVVEIVLDSPPANALGLEIIEGLHAAMDYAEAAGAKVIVVTSAMDGFFAAGADIKHMSSVDAASFREYGDALRGALERLAALPWSPWPPSTGSRLAAVSSWRWHARCVSPPQGRGSGFPRSSSA